MRTGEGEEERGMHKLQKSFKVEDAEEKGRGEEEQEQEGMEEEQR